MTTPPRILTLSFSEHRSDARVLRQISVLRRHGDVTSMGYGDPADGVADHVRIDRAAPSLPQTPLGVVGLAVRRHRAVEFTAPAIAQARAALRGRPFDLVVANDARTLALAHDVAAGAPVWADLHEWAPAERTHVTSWRLLVAPLMEYLCRTYLPRCAAVTTVCDSLAERYREEFGVDCQVVRNAVPWQDLSPTPVDDRRIRLVHSGGAVPGRAIETLIQATALAGDRFTLDLYLVAARDGGRYLGSLRRSAAPHPGITFHDPVAPADLPRTLNAYDVGVFCQPPIHVNARFALPNKLFDYVQARIAVAVGPAVEMARVVNDHRLGVVSEDFSAASFAATLRSLDADRVRAAKDAADVASRDLSSERDEMVEDRIVATALAGR